MRKIAVAMLAFGLLVLPAQANDSTAELSTGGLVFVQNDDVEMRSEDLFISSAEIRVRYRFFNKSAKDVAVLVAFPMPDVTRDESSNISVPTEDPVNLLQFTTRVNGQTVNAEAEQRVFVGSVEYTSLLRELNIPLAPHLEIAAKALDALPPVRWSQFERFKLAEVEEWGTTGGKMERHLTPRWTLRTTFHWQQTFPAQKETVIEHRYKPSVGQSVMTALTSPLSKDEPWIQNYMTKYCIEKDIMDRLDRARRAAKSDGSPPFGEERIDYILKTGANWSGPIREFRLVVDKGDAKNLVSFCGDGVKKIGATQFEMRKTNFTPQGNFSVLILKPLPVTNR